MICICMRPCYLSRHRASCRCRCPRRSFPIPVCYRRWTSVHRRIRAVCRHRILCRSTGSGAFACRCQTLSSRRSTDICIEAWCYPPSGITPYKVAVYYYTYYTISNLILQVSQVKHLRNFLILQSTVGLITQISQKNQRVTTPFFV